MAYLKNKSTPIKTGGLTTSPVNRVVTNTKSVLTVKPLVTVLKPIKNVKKSILNVKNSVPVTKSTDRSIPKFAAKPIPKVIIKEPVLQKRNYLSYSQDKLNITEIKISNNSFNASEIDQSISVKRPELLMIFNYSPIFIGNPKNQILSNIGKLVEIQHQAAYLRRDLIGELTLNIQNSTDQKSIEQFGTLIKTFNKKLNDLELLVGSYNGLIKNKEEIQKRFNIKSLSGTGISIVKNLSRLFSNGQSASPTVKQFFKNRMGYSEQQFESFSNTKVYIQLLADLKNIIENYSFNLLGLTDPDRVQDTSAVKIDTTYTINDGFSFDISKLRSTSTPIDAININNFNKILSSLPPDANSRIKILINFLSKEYRVSSELGDPANKKILDDFDSGNSGSPFDNILGFPDKNIFTLPRGEKSLLSLAQLKIDDSVAQSQGVNKEDFFVLPFEEKFINFEKEDKTYVPGKYYFADAIFETSNDAFNIQPLVAFEQEFSTKFTKTKTALTTLLQLDVRNILDSDSMFVEILNSCYTSTNGMATDGESRYDLGKQKNLADTDINQAVISSLFKLANQDNLLKNYLFQYLLLSGISTNSSIQIVWQSLVDELQVLDKFTALKYEPQFTERDLNNGPNVVKPHLENLAKTIEDRVYVLLTNSVPVSEKNNSSSNKSMRTFDLEPGVKVQNLNKNSISKALQIQTGLTSNSSNFCKEFLNLAVKFTSAASIKTNEFGYLLEDKSGRTKYNFISTSTQLLVLFEIFSNVVNLFTKVEFGKSKTQGAICIRTFGEEQRQIFNVLSQFVTNQSTNQVQSKNVKIARGLLNPNTNSTSTVQKSSKISNRNGIVATGNNASSKKLSENFTNNYHYTTISDIVTKLKDEDQVIIESISILEAIKESLAQAKEIAENFSKFTMNHKGGILAGGTSQEIVNFLTHLNDIEDKKAAGSVQGTSSRTLSNLEMLFKLNGLGAIKLLTNETQLRNASYILDNLKERALNLGNQNPLLAQNPSTGLYDNIIVSNEVKDEIKDTLYSYLSTADFTEQNNAATRMKLMTVGIPSGFTKSLQDKLSAESADNIGISSLQKKQSDVVKIKVYKRDMQYDDLVFKPKEYIFDLSVYVTENDIIRSKPDKNEMFNNILQRVTVSDYENFANPEHFFFQKTQENKKSIITEQKYSFLSIDQKTDLFKNHISSYLLQNFLYLSTGMMVNEENFLTREEMKNVAKSSFDRSFETILKNYFVKVMGEEIPNEKSLEQIQDDQNISKDVRNIVKMYRSGNVLCNPDKIYHKCFGQKFFDRVFHLPVNIDLFEIDMEETKKTSSGRTILDKTFLTKNIVIIDNKHYLKNRTDNDLILEDYFITIETVI